MVCDSFDTTEPAADYAAEPEVVFSPLSPIGYCRFYDLEMNGFTDDQKFYLDSLAKGMHVLEAGCGNGRLCRAFAAAGLQVTGIDLSSEMLAAAALEKTTNISYIGMDMAELAFSKRFDAIVVAYNTLNLLADPPRTEACLAGFRRCLKKNGLLLLQIYLPQRSVSDSGQTRTFQFQIFDTKNGDKVIKETLKHFNQDGNLIMEERYRVRPLNNPDANEDLAHSMTLLNLEATDWLRMITNAGFTVNARYGGFDLTPFRNGRDHLLLLQARAS